MFAILFCSHSKSQNMMLMDRFLWSARLEEPPGCVCLARFCYEALPAEAQRDLERQRKENKSSLLCVPHSQLTSFGVLADGCLG